MRYMLACTAAVALLFAAAPGLADVIQDDFLIDLDESQISTVPGGMSWQVNGLETTDELLFTGDLYIGNIDFANDEVLGLTNVTAIHFMTHSVSAAQYNVDYTYWGKTFGGLELIMQGNVTSDLAGAAGGTFELPEPIASLELTGIKLDLSFQSGSTMFASLDIGLRAETIEIIPEPASLALMLVGGLLALGRGRA
jgi:hypothetical protein